MMSRGSIVQFLTSTSFHLYLEVIVHVSIDIPRYCSGLLHRWMREITADRVVDEPQPALGDQVNYYLTAGRLRADYSVSVLRLG
jgi:hypothetical protein